MSNIDTIAYARAGKMFACTNVSAKIVTVVGAAMTGLILSNPTGSGKYLAFMTAGYSTTTALASIISIGISISPVQPTAPATTTVGSAVIRNATGGAAGSVADTYDVATLGAAPVAVRWFAGQDWITGGNGQHPYSWETRIDGEIGLMPGASAAFCGLGGTIVTGLGSFSYVEVDL